ncbi:MAG: ABC transporter ATP-binding protein, partial [Clostridiaceae bacterium]|nr:ABC transporter ATP-binding protein [Clostridiaceae bacterium]
MSQPVEQEFTSKIDLGIWKRFLKHASVFKRELFVLFGFMVGLALLENITPLLARYAIDNFIKNRSADGITTYALIYLLIIILQAVAIRFYLYYAGRIETGLNFEIREAGFRNLQNLSFSYFDRTPVGWIMSRMVSDTNRLSEVLAWSLVDIAWGLTTIIVVMITMFIMDVRLALLGVVLIPVLMVVSFFFQKRLLAAHRRIRRVNSRLTGAFNEGIMGARTSKTLRREAENNREFGEMADGLYRESVKASVFAALFMPIVSLLGATGTALVLTFGGQMVASGVLLTGTLYAFVLYVMRLWDP